MSGSRGQISITHTVVLMVDVGLCRNGFSTPMFSHSRVKIPFTVFHSYSRRIEFYFLR